MKVLNKKTRIIVSILMAICMLNFAIRLIPFSFLKLYGGGEIWTTKLDNSGSDNIELQNSIFAWVEFWIFLEIQIVATLFLIAFLGVRELVRGQQGSRLRGKTYLILTLFVAILSTAFIDREIASSAILNNRWSWLPLEARYGLYAFILAASTGVIIAFIFDPKQTQANIDSRLN